MVRSKHAELPNCQPIPLRYKETPLVNGSDQTLVLCNRCEGDGHICSAERKTRNKAGEVTGIETVAEFAGRFRRQRERGGVDGRFSLLPRLQGRRTYLQREFR